MVDTANPTAVVGDGTAASCTEAALQAAVASGGIVTFDCGSAPVTITVTQTITVDAETTLDGGGLITLSGGDTTRILYLDSDYNTPTPRLTVQRLTFTHGKSTRIADDTDGGGAAIYRDGGSLTVIDSMFLDNHAPATGQDLAGGAIYGFGGGETVIVGSTFANNTASDGGAVGSLNGDLTIINSTLSNNAATGSDGNPGNGGCGGAVYMDGADEAANLCGVTISNNTAGAIGGGVFRVSNTHDGSFAMDRSTVDGNALTVTQTGNAGGLYLEGLALTISNTTISRNRGSFNGGIWIHTCTVDITNVTIAENEATADVGGNGAGIWLSNTPTGTLTNGTIANNRSLGSDTVCGGIFGDGLTLVNTIVANNTAMFTKTCDVTRPDGSGNLQWPDDSHCTETPLIEDPLLGALAAASGADNDAEVMTPGAGSPAKGIGTNCPPTDQLGNPRPTPCTAGAVEAP